MTPDGPILGLPLHPLVVHLVVIALPVGALATIATVLWPSFRTRYGLLSLATLSVGALSSIVARVSGEALAQTETLPERHAGFGSALVVSSLATAAVAWAWWWLERRREQAPPGRSSLATIAAGALAVTACVAVAGLTALTGHSGADAVWGSGRAVAAPAASGPAARTYTMADVAQHADASSCWAAIRGEVYDLTAWIDEHPGGPQRIRNLCGTDATAQFTAQHDTAERPNLRLETYRIGALA